jgi:drug/metabolite transporter (DMT)-like permease
MVAWLEGIAAAVGRNPFALLLLPPLFWAGNLLIGRAYAAELPPYGLTFWRWVVASALVLPFVWRELAASRRLLLAHAPVILACGATAFAGYPILNYVALQTTPAATAAMINSTLPLMIPLFAWLVAGETPAARVVAGIVLSFAGVGWIVTAGDWAVLASFAIGRGELLMLGAVACYALYAALLRYRPAGLSDLAFVAAMTMTTALMVLPLWILEEVGGRHFPFQPFSIASLLFIALFASLIAPALWNRCAAVLGATPAGATFHLMAIYAAALAFVLLGEPIRRFHLVGIGLILAGFAVAVWPRRVPHPSTEARPHP